MSAPQRLEVGRTQERNRDAAALLALSAGAIFGRMAAGVVTDDGRSRAIVQLGLGAALLFIVAPQAGTALGTTAAAWAGAGSAGAGAVDIAAPGITASAPPGETRIERATRRMVPA